MHDDKRTLTQNNAIHLYITQVSEELCERGITMNKVIELFDKIEIEATPEVVKNDIWRPIQIALFGKEKKSTTKLTREQVTKVYENVSRFLTMLEISIPFPSEDTLINEELSK